MRSLILTLALTSSFNAQASFEQTRLRYYSPIDLLSVLHQKFPAIRDNLPKNFCRELRSANSHLLGANSPVSGKPAQPLPASPFLRWYFECAKSVAEHQFILMFEREDRRQFENYLAPVLLQKYGKSPLKYNGLLWNNLTDSERHLAVSHLLKTFIGPEEVLKDLDSTHTFEQKIASISNYAALYAKTPDAYERLRWLAVAVVLQSEFLRY